MEITGKEAPARAAPSTAQGGTKNTRRRLWSGRGGWSRAEDGPPPSSSAAEISHYNLLESGYPAVEHVNHIRTKIKPAFKCALKDGMNLHTPTLKLHFFSATQLIYCINLKPDCICQSESTQLLLWFYYSVCSHNGSTDPTFSFFIFTHVLMQSWQAHEAISQNVSDPLTLLLSLEESNTPSCLLLATLMPPDLFSVHVLCLLPKGHLLKIAWHQAATRARKPHQPIRSQVSVHLHIYGSKILLIQHVHKYVLKNI